MKNSERGKFEDAWNKAFENAEQAPSENVWEGVDRDLNKTEAVMMKRRVVFYQRLAAAAILFALLLGGLSTYYISDLTRQQDINLAQKKASEIFDDHEVLDNSNTKTSSENSESKIIPGNDSAIDSYPDNHDKNKSGKSAGFVTNLFNHSDKSDKVGKASMVKQEHAIIQSISHDYPSLLSTIPEPSIALMGKMREVTIVRKLPAIPSSFMKSKNDKEPKENLWASLGASTGNYSPSSDFGSSSSTVRLQNSANYSSAQSAYSTTSSKGSVFSVGMNVGKRISKRWLVQGGVSYLNQAIGYTSNFAMVDANNTVLASVADFANFKSFSSVIPVSSAYEINSVNEFISVPVQAGFLLIDKTLGLQLNSGVSTDIFMQNTLTDKSGQLASYSSGSGDASPYRTVSWAGLLGTEVSYKIATQYRISLVPGLRYSLNSVLKSDSSPSNPLVWDVGFRFRYIFK